MESRFAELFARVYSNEKTRRNYMVRLETMMRKVDAKTLLEVLEDPDKWYPLIREAYPSLTTRKNVLTPILALFREDDGLSKTAAAKWKRLHDDLGKHQEARVKRSEPDAKQIAQYTSFEEIESKYEELKKKSPHKTQRASLKYVLLSVLVHLRPKRADLGAVQIYYNTDPADTEKNYLVLRDAGSEGVSFLALNLYKTSKHHQTVEEELPEGVVRDIRASLARWPRSYLFVAESGDPMSNNTYTQFVRRTFEELFGRSTGVSMLRHIYITEKLNFDNMTLEEQEEEARLMMHTSGLQRRYKWPKKTICPKLCASFIRGSGTRRLRRGPRASGRRQTRRKEGSRRT